MEKNLNNLSTKELVEELKTREGVHAIEVPPHETKNITTEGPSIIIEVID